MLYVLDFFFLLRFCWAVIFNSISETKRSKQAKTTIKHKRTDWITAIMMNNIGEENATENYSNASNYIKQAFQLK